MVYYMVTARSTWMVFLIKMLEHRMNMKNMGLKQVTLA